jgi:hypothetical protein
VVICGGAVYWASKKQPTAVAFTLDAEYQAKWRRPEKGLSLGKALGEMALLPSDFPSGGHLEVKRCNNKTALSLCKDR